MTEAQYGDAKTYAETIYEASALKDPMRQTGLGAVWYNGDKSFQTRYHVNKSGMLS